MLILIHKDSATKVPKEVTPAEAAGFAKDFVVEVVNDDNTYTPFAEWLEANPIEEEEPQDQFDAELAAFTKSGKTESQWRKMKKADRDALIAAETAPA